MPAARLWSAALLGVGLGGCSLAPTYAPPTIPATQTYKEIGPWTPAAPADAQPRGAWWTMFGDPVLDDLETRAETANPDLAGALAAYDQARALAAQARSDLFPDLGLSASAERTHRSDNAPLRNGGADAYSTIQGGSVLSYELDLWGRIRNQVAASGARAQASAADLQSVRLSLQAELADSYFILRRLDAERRVLDSATEAFARALKLTQILHDGGNATGLDVGRAQTQLSTARAQISEVAAQRALYEHAIAALVGENASRFTLAPTPTVTVQPVVAVSAPSVLLQRRPDIAVAERRAAAANAEIGVARAAWFPSLTLGGSGGYESGGGINLFQAPNTFWMVGPELAAPLFDGGRRRAGVQASRAAYAQASAAYRAAVLAGFRDVEDQLAQVNHLATQAEDQDAALAAAKRTEALALIRYQQGVSDYLDVVTAQTAALQAERSAIQLRGRRLQASVDLVRALGGDWR